MQLSTKQEGCSHTCCGARLPEHLPSTMALPTNGRVIIDTTAGEIDIELWSKV